METDVVPVKVELDPSDPIVEEVKDANTDEKRVEAVVDDILDAFEEGGMTGGGPEKRKRGQAEEEENPIDRARRLQRERVAREEAEREARGEGDGAGSQDPAGAGAGTAAPADVVMSGTTPAPVSQSLTRKAVREAISAFNSMGEEFTAAIDASVAWVIVRIPRFLKAAAAGATGTFLLKNPTLFAQLIRLFTAGAQTALTGMAGDVGWDTYGIAAKQIITHLRSLGLVAYDVVPGSPVIVLSAVLALMKHRANKAGMTLEQLLASDLTALQQTTTAVAEATGAGAGAGAAAVSTLRNPISIAAEIIFSQFVRAYTGVTGALGEQVSAAQKSAQFAAAGELGQKAKKAAKSARQGKSGEGSAQIAAAVRGLGAPSVQSGPFGARPVPFGDPQNLEPVLKKLSLAGIPASQPAASFWPSWSSWFNRTKGTGVGAAVAGLGAGAGAMVSGVGQRLSGAFGWRSRDPREGAGDVAPQPGEDVAMSGTGEGSGVAPSDAPLPRTGTGSVPVPSSLLPPPRRPLEEAKEPEDVAMRVPGAAAPMDVDKPEEVEKKGGRRRKTSKNKRKTYRKKGKKTRGKTRGRRSFIY